MGDIWQEHRKYILSLILGGLVFLISWLVISSIYSSDIRLHDQRIRKARRTPGLPGNRSLKKARAARKTEETLFQEMVNRVKRVPAPGYEITQGGGSADLHYSRQIDLMRREVVELCALKNIAVDQNLGLPSKFPSTRKEKSWYLMGLDVVRQILLMALEADQAMEGGIVRVDNISIVGKKTGRGVRRESFQELLPVSFSIVGHPMAVDLMMRGLPAYEGALAGNSGQFLTVLSAVTKSLDQPDQATRGRRRTYRDPADSNRVRLELQVAAVILDVNAKLKGTRP